MYCAANGFDYCQVTTLNGYLKLDEMPENVCVRIVSKQRVSFYIQYPEVRDSCEGKSLFEF